MTDLALPRDRHFEDELRHAGGPLGAERQHGLGKERRLADPRLAADVADRHIPPPTSG